MSDPQEAATPSDPHSAELIATLRREAALWDAEGPTPQMLLTAAEALEARDAEVAELKAKIAAAVARLNAASIPPMMTEAQFNATTITDARRILLGSASSPVEGGN